MWWAPGGRAEAGHRDRACPRHPARAGASARAGPPAGGARSADRTARTPLRPRPIASRGRTPFASGSFELPHKRRWRFPFRQKKKKQNHHRGFVAWDPLRAGAAPGGHVSRRVLAGRVAVRVRERERPSGSRVCGSALPPVPPWFILRAAGVRGFVSVISFPDRPSSAEMQPILCVDPAPYFAEFADLV